MCDYIEDRHGNRTTLSYDQSATLADGSTKALLTKVTDPVGRTLTFTWANLGSAGQPAWRITQVQGPAGTYSVLYGYNSDKNLQSVTLDSGGANRVTTYGYTSVTGQDSNGSTVTETGLLSSITDGLNHSVTYGYGSPSNNPLGTVYVSSVTEPGGVDTGGNARTLTWSLTMGYGYSGLYSSVQSNAPSLSALGISLSTDGNLRTIEVRGSSSFTGIFSTTYDTNNNVLMTGESLVGPGSTYGLYTQATYGPHGNVLTQNGVNPI